MGKFKKAKKATLEYFGGDELAANVFLTKYALRDKSGDLVEETPDDMHDRLAQEFTRMEEKFGGPRALSYEAIRKYLNKFDKIVPQGSPMMGIGNNYVNVSLSNCVVVASPADSVSSIMDSGRDLANLFKRRCGVGLDISELRPEDAPVNNSAGTTTGAWSFADFYSYVCRMIGQNGRRGALMITMDVSHPDIEKFVMMKHDLTKVTGANVSVKVNDSFMEAVENKGTFTLKFPVDSENPTTVRDIDAVDLWNKIVESATATAEPGLLMWGNIIKNLPAECYKSDGFKTLTTNPCGEIPLSAYDSCRLISINLKNFVKNKFENDAYFDFVEFSETVTNAMRLSDDLVELEVEKLTGILEICDTTDERDLWQRLLNTCKKGRRTGLGTHGLADALACLSLAYDGDEALSTIDKIYGTLKISAYAESVQLAQERGSFPVFSWDKEKDNAFIKSLPSALQKLISAHGRRNISILTNAPTGSVSILSQTSSGLEPVFRNSYIRRRKLSHNETKAEADFVDNLGDRWLEYKVYHHNVQAWMSKYDSNDVPEFFRTSDSIEWPRRIDVQSTIQKHIDHSISSTINLPKGTPPATVAELYFQGWKKGLKGITVYVDGSRSGVLISNSEQKEKFIQNEAVERPHELECEIHHTTIKGERWTILVGLMESKPYEVMGGLSNLIEIPKKYISGKLIKHMFKTKNNRYDLMFGETGAEVAIKDIVSVYDNPNNSAFTRMISLALRTGAKPSFLVEQLQKDKDSDMYSFAHCIARILKNYIKNGEKVTTSSCQECTGALTYQDGCAVCQTCGFSKCG
jgi:ribonucleoside-diphosphate reductase alpha chain